MADRRLQVFHCVAKQLSFTKAAELLCMTQPAVTFQVKQLEEHFNTRLFERKRMSIELTPAGKLAFDYAERILLMNEEMQVRVGELSAEVSGPLQLGASTTIAEFILPRILGEFKALYPQVQTQMFVANSEIIENRVAQLNLDLGFVESPSHLPHVLTQVCCQDELVAICAPSHRLARLMAVDAQELRLEPIVSRESGSGTREFADQFFRASNVAPEELNIVMELGSPEAIKGVIESGWGLGIMSKISVAKELQLGTLVAVALKPRLMREFSLLSPSGKFRSRLVNVFAEYAMKRMRSMASQAPQ